MQRFAHSAMPHPEPEKADESGAAFPKTCPSRQVIEMLADKWKLLLLHLLHDGPRRNGQLMKDIEGISQKMLTQSLRAMERDGLVARRDYQTIPPKVDYTLTEMGRSLRGCMLMLSDWGVTHHREILNARRAHDAPRD